MLNQAATFSTPVVEFQRPLLCNVSGSVKVLLKYLFLAPKLAPIMQCPALPQTLQCASFLSLNSFLKPPSALATLKYISYYGNTDVIHGGEGQQHPKGQYKIILLNGLKFIQHLGEILSMFKRAVNFCNCGLHDVCAHNRDLHLCDAYVANCGIKRKKKREARGFI